MYKSSSVPTFPAGTVNVTRKVVPVDALMRLNLIEVPVKLAALTLRPLDESKLTKTNKPVISSLSRFLANITP